MPGFAHAGHDQPAACAGDQIHGGDESSTEAVMNGGGKRGDAGRLDLERSHRRGDQLAGAGARSSLRAQRLGHDGRIAWKPAAGDPRLGRAVFIISAFVSLKIWTGFPDVSRESRSACTFAAFWAIFDLYTNQEGSWGTALGFPYASPREEKPT